MGAMFIYEVFHFYVKVIKNEKIISKYFEFLNS